MEEVQAKAWEAGFAPGYSCELVMISSCRKKKRLLLALILFPCYSDSRTIARKNDRAYALGASTGFGGDPILPLTQCGVHDAAGGSARPPWKKNFDIGDGGRGETDGASTYYRPDLALPAVRSSSHMSQCWRNCHDVTRWNS